MTLYFFRYKQQDQVRHVIVTDERFSVMMAETGTKVVELKDQSVIDCFIPAAATDGEFVGAVNAPDGFLPSGTDIFIED